MKRLSALLVIVTSAAFAQTAEEHAAHHPDQQKAASEKSAQSAQPAADSASKNMEKMQALMAKIRESKDPAERRRLLDEHRKAMHEQMDMMRMMGHEGSGMMNGEMMQRCSDMGVRMNMMQMMMEQMLAHDEAERIH